jgi:hypothetical protein
VEEEGEEDRCESGCDKGEERFAMDGRGRAEAVGSSDNAAMGRG